MSADSRNKKGHEALIINDEEVRIVMVGKTGAGKSATGNTILGAKAFDSKFATRSVTVNCKRGRGVAAGKKVSVIDTPGLFDTTFSKEETNKEMAQCIGFASPGPHVFLTVIQLGRFTEEEQKSVEMIQETFGQKSNEYTMILFTNGDRLEDEPFEEMLNLDPKLQELIDKCEGRYHVFNNKTKDPSQVTELMEKIKSMVQMNGGNHYTSEMFQAAEKAIEEKKQRILKETEEKRRKEEEKLKKKYDAEALEKEKKMQKEHQEQQARLAKEMDEKIRKKEEEVKKKQQEQQRKHAREMEELKKKQEKESLEEEEKMKQLQEKYKEQQKRTQEENEKREKELKEEKTRAQEENEKIKKEHERQQKERKERAERVKEQALREKTEEDERQAREQAEIANRAGAFKGAAAGASAGAALAGALAGPIGAAAGALVGGIVGGIAGWFK